MQNNRNNKARLIYTLSTEKPNSSSYGGVKLNNGYYLAKEAKSDEKMYFSETEIANLVRTILFMHVFRTCPNESILSIINTGTATFTEPRTDPSTAPLTIKDIVRILDDCLGPKIWSVIKRPVLKVYSEYMRQWRFYAYGAKIKLPSVHDYVSLYRFINIVNAKYSYATKFVLNNSKDNNVFNQNLVKYI